MGNEKSKLGASGAAPQGGDTDTATSANNSSAPAASTTPAAAEEKEITIDETQLPEYTLEEVEKHDREETGVWLVLGKLVYDVTQFMPNHPGGPSFLLDVAGTDASQEFEAAIHSESAKNMTKKYVIGKLKQDKSKKKALALPNSLASSLGQNNLSSGGKQNSLGSKGGMGGYPGKGGYGGAMGPNKGGNDKKQVGFRKKDVMIIYGSQTGTSAHYAKKLFEDLSNKLSLLNKSVGIVDMCEYDSEDLEKEQIVIFLISTYENGEAPEKCKYFVKWLQEAQNDCRVDGTFLQKLRFAVFGFGNSLYEENYNRAAIKLCEDLKALQGNPLVPVTLCDNNVSRADGVEKNVESDFNEGVKQLMPILSKALEDKKYGLNTIKKSAAEKEENEVETQENNEAKNEKDGEEEEIEVKTSHTDELLTDLEDMGAMLSNSKLAGMNAKKAVEKKENEEGDQKEKRAMVTPTIRQSLTKQGYKVIGSHSGVKLCRWTKSMLRGRGGCYKHTMYGIVSYQCMEATPSLACANKCVFCWRHHTNPVGKEWKWLQDGPDFIVNNAILKHSQMIKEFGGAPGVSPERLQDALMPRHCALSLVGEPIMYPKINELIKILHSKHISTFLVTNAQFPEALQNLVPVTQLYVSIDAATPDELKKVDRPLFKDYWQRFLTCLKIISGIDHSRSVYRLTLVKAFNMTDVSNYARLIALGQPDFIEVKGVTFCGASSGSNLTMNNVPFHFEVRRFCEKLVQYLGQDYGLACEHAHSNCVLIASKKLCIQGKWHTWIDYEKFDSLFRKYVESEGKFKYTILDYCKETPSWALYDSKEEGFDPKESRFVKKRRHQNNNNGTGQSSEGRLENAIKKAQIEVEMDKKTDGMIDENVYLKEKERFNKQTVQTLQF